MAAKIQEDHRMKISNKVRAEVHFATVHSTYWMQYCALSGFTAVYLAYEGFSDTQIGITNSIINFLAVFVQLFIADYSDKHFTFPIKKLIAIMYIITMGLSAAVNFIAIPIAMMMIVYAAASAFSISVDSFISAMNMQYTNLGKPLRYGWPRSVGSASYATMALILGILIRKYSPAFLLDLHLIIAAIAVLAVMFVPAPSKYASPEVYAANAGRRSSQENVSYIKMIRSNPIMVLLLISLLLYSTAISPTQNFLVRLFESLGGDTSQFGIASFCWSMCEIPTLLLSDWLFRKFNHRRMVVVTVIVTLIRMIILTFVKTSLPIYFVQALGGLNNGLFVASTMEFANMIVHNGERVRAQSLVGLSKTLGYIIGNAYGGRIMELFGFQRLSLIGSVLCAVATVIMIVCSRMFASKQSTASVIRE